MAEQKPKPDWSKIGKSNSATSKASERRIANLLTEWSGVPFRRRRVEGRDDAVRMVELTADVIPVAGNFIFSVEVKKGKGFSLDALMANPRNCLISDWWFQCSFDAQLLQSTLKRRIYPMLFVKPHPNHDWLIVSRNAIADITSKTLGAARWPDFPHLVFEEFEHLGKVSGNVSHSSKNKKIVEIELEPMILCRWRDFANSVDPASTFVGGLPTITPTAVPG